MNQAENNSQARLIWLLLKESEIALEDAEKSELQQLRAVHAQVEQELHQLVNYLPAREVPDVLNRSILSYAFANVPEQTAPTPIWAWLQHAISVGAIATVVLLALAVDLGHNNAVQTHFQLGTHQIDTDLDALEGDLQDIRIFFDSDYDEIVCDADVQKAILFMELLEDTEKLLTGEST